MRAIARVLVKVRLRGRGMEYEESRAYVHGDDVRTMDWRVMARTGEAHTKVFAEEKERRFLIAADLSASMYFGTRFSFKSWAAAHVAAHVGWLASFAGDRIGGLIVTPESHHEVRPGQDPIRLTRRISPPGPGEQYQATRRCIAQPPQLFTARD